MDYTRSEAKAAARERFRGLWAATTTPFDDVGRLDEGGLAADMDRLTGELGVDGVFCAGVMSEFWALSGAERHRLVTAVVAAARGKCQVIAHTGHHSVTETIELTRHAEAAGELLAVALLEEEAGVRLRHGPPGAQRDIPFRNAPGGDLLLAAPRGQVRRILALTAWPASSPSAPAWTRPCGPPDAPAPW